MAATSKEPMIKPLQRYDADLRPGTMLAALLCLIACMYTTLARNSYMTDFRAFYLASVSVHDGLDPYRNQVNVDEKFALAGLDTVESSFLYPPSSLFFFAPWGRLSYDTSKLLFAMTLALLMAAILVFFRERYNSPMAVAIALFVCNPTVSNFDKGQVDIWILGMLLCAFFLADGWIAGCFLGAAIALKLWPIVLVVWFLGARRWRTAGWSVASFGALTAASIAIWGKAMFREFLEHLAQHADRLHSFRPLLIHDFKTIQVLFGQYVVVGGKPYVLTHLYGDGQNPLLHLGRYASPAGLAILLGYYLWLFATRAGRQTGAEGGFFGAIVAALFCNSILWPMSLVACFPLLLYIVNRSRTPFRAALFMLAPFFLPLSAVQNRQFVLWLVAAGYCVWENSRQGELESIDGANQTALA